MTGLTEETGNLLNDYLSFTGREPASVTAMDYLAFRRLAAEEMISGIGKQGMSGQIRQQTAVAIKEASSEHIQEEKIFSSVSSEKEANNRPLSGKGTAKSISVKPASGGIFSLMQKAGEQG